MYIRDRTTGVYKLYGLYFFIKKRPIAANATISHTKFININSMLIFQFITKNVFCCLNAGLAPKNNRFCNGVSPNAIIAM